MGKSNDQLLSALLKAKETIKALHGPDGWEIYDKCSPEMKEINAAIDAAQPGAAADSVVIHVKNMDRAEIEAASNGTQTVLTTAKGQPTHMNVVPAFRLEELGEGFGTGLHPAFIVNGVEKPNIFIGTYQAIIRDGEALSLPGQDPTCGINFDQARAACQNAGPGFHLMTNWEWAAIALWCRKNGISLRGNTSHGRSHENGTEAGTITKYGRIATGSGPDTWRHDGTPFGIADLAGNVWEWNDGLKLDSGKIVMPADNNYLLPESDWPETGYVFDIKNGEPALAREITKRSWNSVRFADMEAVDDSVLKSALLAPIDLPGRFWADNNEGFEALPFRGGSWYFGGYAGLAALDLVFERVTAYDILGFRPAFIR